MEKEKYACKSCDCVEFVTQPNKYDIFVAENNKLLLQKTEFINEEFEFFCRECSEKLEFEEEEVII